MNNLTKYNVAEKFISINGEGQRAGQLAVFIRFSGCNLRCSYCDTKWANDFNMTCQQLTVQEIKDYIIKSGFTNVTLTGGEPLLQENIDELISELINANFWVEIETNGSVPISPIETKKRPHFTMDYKLPSSGMEDKMILENMNLLTSDDVVKFVCGSDDDLNKAYEIIKEYNLDDRCKVYLSCVFGQLEPAKVVDFMIKHKLNKINLQLQMHKFIWDPDKKGV